MARILSCVSSAKRGWSSAEKIDKSSRVNWMPNWRRTQFRSKKAIHLSMRSGSCRDVLSPAFRNTTKRDDAKRGDDLDRERKEKRERERAIRREKKKGARPTDLFVPFFFMQELMEIFLKRFLETTTKRSPSKISLSREKKDVHQPLKTTTEEEEERTIERTMLATDVNGKAPFERLREFQRLAIARSLAYRGLYLKKLG